MKKKKISLGKYFSKTSLRFSARRDVIERIQKYFSRFNSFLTRCTNHSLRARNKKSVFFFHRRNKKAKKKKRF